MINSKAVGILRSLSREEIKQFRDFVYSPYHNTNKTLCKLFDLLRKHYPVFEDGKIEKENLYAKLFPGKPYNEQVMKNLSSELLSVCLNFLAVNKYLTQGLYDVEIDTLSQLNAKRLDASFNKKWKELEKELGNSENMIHPLFYHLHRMETEKTKFHIARNEQPVVAGKVLKTGEYLIYYFLTELSRIAIDIHSNIHAFNAVYSTNLVHKFIELFDFEALINYMKENNYEYGEMIRTYYYRLMSTLYDRDDDYNNFRKLLYENLHRFSDPEKSGLLLSLEQCAIHRGNQGKPGALSDQFDAMKKQFETGVFRRIKKNMSLMNFRNIVHISVMMKEIGWAQDFVNENIDLVSSASRENVLNHSMGIISYVKNDYDMALEYFNKVSLENPFYASDIKSHTAIIFYEQGHYDSALSALDSFRHIVSNRDDFTAVFKEVNLRFINIFNSLIRMRFNNNYENAQKLKDKLASFGMVNHKGWLARKIDSHLDKKA